MSGTEAQWKARPALAERRAEGAAARQHKPRTTLANLTTTGRDPMAILEEQDATRVQQMVPLRHERMSASPFAFYRATAAIMAADLANDADTGISVGSCGDAHVANFGFYASPQRTILFDVNDFDEAAWAPWEWDVKRLVTSIVIAGRATDRDRGVVRDAAYRAVRRYTLVIAEASETSPLERYWAHFDEHTSVDAIDKISRNVLKDAINAARKRTGESAVRKMTRPDADGRLRFIIEPPAMIAVPEPLQEVAEARMRAYMRSANVDIRLLLQHYTKSDTAFRAVGVGSVGTRCYVTVLQDGDGNTILLQTKEAQQSVLIKYGKAPQPDGALELLEEYGEGGRVVGMQRVLQAVSDPFLGHMSDDNGDYYVRQFRDMKGGIDMETLADEQFTRFGEACASTLAHAHGRTADAAQVAGYIGSSSVVADAVVAWADAYADLAYEDWKAFVARPRP
ncbi:DUF2252 domain-containing protein [Microbacterium sp. ASV49]|uniref:DUF2252 domain-containing protein n=1 Tax=Microbacterium candidum TaxID=3041922 RepID=A0ABT7MTC3_9MICO|nr:DUF2252 domain-containing protein [Microbacterium sp. ASV49]MDL9977708.1 DUF2252 domain-containing protein [Microbacterium sp. ASV49]